MQELGEIASIKSGVGNPKIEKFEMKNYQRVRLLSGEMINYTGIIQDVTSFEEVWIPDNLSEHFFLRKGDLLLQTRGSTFRVSIFNIDESDQSYIVNSNIQVLRADSDKVLPEVLCYFLNTKAFLEKVIQRTRKNTLLITAKQLSKIKIDIPEQQIQEAMKVLIEKQAQLQRETELLLKKRLEYSESVFFDHINWEFNDAQH